MLEHLIITVFILTYVIVIIGEHFHTQIITMTIIHRHAYSIMTKISTMVAAFETLLLKMANTVHMMR